MTSDEDPEQRIADLERPLLMSAADSEPIAHASRLGLRLGWVVLALMTVGLIAGGWAILGGRDAGTVSGRPTTEPMIGGGGTVSEIPTAPTRSHHSPDIDTAAPVAPPGSAAPPSAPPPGEAVSVAGVGNNRTIACTDNAVSISGVNNTVVLTGHCTRVDVSGIENVVTVDSADSIVVSGMNNSVTFHSGTPELNNSGFGNSLAQR